MLEQTYGVTIFVMPSVHDVKGTHAAIERAQDREHVPRRIPAAAPVRMDSALQDEPEDDTSKTDMETGAEDGDTATEVRVMIRARKTVMVEAATPPPPWPPGWPSR